VVLWMILYITLVDSSLMVVGLSIWEMTINIRYQSGVLIFGYQRVDRVVVFPRDINRVSSPWSLDHWSPVYWHGQGKTYNVLSSDIRFFSIGYDHTLDQWTVCQIVEPLDYEKSLVQYWSIRVSVRSAQY